MCVCVCVCVCVQCGGRVNSSGITPEEDEEARLDAFCDVRFDTRDPPKQARAAPSLQPPPFKCVGV